MSKATKEVISKINYNRNETKRQAKEFCKKYIGASKETDPSKLNALVLEAKDKLFGRLTKARPC